jgi:hypothetical protein
VLIAKVVDFLELVLCHSHGSRAEASIYLALQAISACLGQGEMRDARELVEN